MSRPHLAEFAELLGAVREQAGLTVRQLGRSTNYSHPHVARAATGKKLPSWQLTSAYLNACGVGGEDLQSWRRLWTIAKDKERRFRKSGPTALAPLAADADWQRAVSTVRAIEPLLPFVRKVTTLDELSIALVRLGMRRGLDSLRKVEATTGIPRATLHGWYTGKRKPSEARLDELVVGLGATRAEQHEFAECLERVAETVTCDGIHSPTGKSCARSQLHRGTHRAADGTQWLDEDLIRRPPTEPATTPMPQRLDKLRATHLKVHGPHW